MVILAALLTALAILVGAPARLATGVLRTRVSSRPGRAPAGLPARAPAGSALRRFRAPLAAVAGGGVALGWGGGDGFAIGVGVAATVWVIASRAESSAVLRLREQRAQQLPDVVALLGLALRSGAPVALALEQVRQARPGPAADALAEVGVALRRGAEPRQAWAPLLGDPGLARLARGLIRSAESGSPVADAVARIAAELATERRMAVADRARAVGVKAALPLGVCLLPAFLLIGIVPLVAVSVSTLPR